MYPIIRALGLWVIVILIRGLGKYEIIGVLGPLRPGPFKLSRQCCTLLNRQGWTLQ